MRIMRLSTFVLVLAVGACDRRPDTEENVRKALDEANIRTVDVSVDDESRLIHLSGTVGTLADRRRAEELAAAAVGTTGRVQNELTVMTLEETPADSDEQLTTRLDLLLDEDEVLRERDVNVSVVDGVVTITGEVRSAEEKDRVMSLVKGAPGVTSVSDALRVVRGQ